MHHIEGGGNAERAKRSVYTEFSRLANNPHLYEVMCWACHRKITALQRALYKLCWKAAHQSAHQNEKGAPVEDGPDLAKLLIQHGVAVQCARQDSNLIF